MIRNSFTTVLLYTDNGRISVSHQLVSEPGKIVETITIIMELEIFYSQTNAFLSEDLHVTLIFLLPLALATGEFVRP